MCNYISCDISPETLNSTSSIVFYWNSTFNPGLNTELPGVTKGISVITKNHFILISLVKLPHSRRKYSRKLDFRIRFLECKTSWQ